MSADVPTGRALLVPVALAVIAVLAFTGAASAASDTLPGGTSISVDVVSPPDGGVVNGPNVPVSGTASVGQGVPVPNTRLIYVIDVSGSTDQGPGCGGDQNGDGNADFILDCEIAAAKATNQAAIATGTVADVGSVAFADIAATGDVDPDAGDQSLTAPDADDNTAGGPDIEESLSSAFSDFFGGDGGFTQFTLKNVGQFTNFEAAVAAATALATSGGFGGTKLVVFLSDGVASAGGSVSEEVTAAAAAGVRFETFAIGSNSSCTNTGTSGQGSLEDIALGTGGTCTEVDDLSQLPDVVPGVVASQLTEVAISLDQTVNGAADNPFTPLTNANIDPDLPQVGPASVNWNTVFPGLAPGLYEVCARATGSDGGGTGFVVECSTFRVNAPPVCTDLVATPDELWPPNHKLRLVTITGASDPEGDDIVTAVTGVTQDEPVNGLGDGDVSPDAVLGPLSHQVRLRAERSGTGDGRVYRIAVTVTDEFGLSCDATLRVGVAHDLAHAPIDSAPPSYDSLLP
jgi:trimeric autotransporter adhesin